MFWIYFAIEGNHYLGKVYRISPYTKVVEAYNIKHLNIEVNYTDKKHVMVITENKIIHRNIIAVCDCPNPEVIVNTMPELFI